MNRNSNNFPISENTTRFPAPHTGRGNRFHAQGRTENYAIPGQAARAKSGRRKSSPARPPRMTGQAAARPGSTSGTAGKFHAAGRRAVSADGQG